MCEQVFELIVDPGSQIHGVTALTRQELPLPGQGIFGLESREFAAMKREAIQDQFGIARVIFGSAGVEGPAVLRAGGRINRINIDEVIFP